VEALEARLLLSGAGTTDDDAPEGTQAIPVLVVSAPSQSAIPDPPADPDPQTLEDPPCLGDGDPSPAPSDAVKALGTLPALSPAILSGLLTPPSGGASTSSQPSPSIAVIPAPSMQSNAVAQDWVRPADSKADPGASPSSQTSVIGVLDDSNEWKVYQVSIDTDKGVASVTPATPAQYNEAISPRSWSRRRR